MAEGTTLNEILNFENTLLAELKAMAGIDTEITLADINQLYKPNILLLLRAIKAQGIGTGGTGLTTAQSNALTALITALNANKVLSDNNYSDEEKELLALIQKDGDGSKFLNNAGEYEEVSTEVKPSYKFKPADYGAGNSFFEEDGYGGLIFGGTGGSTGGAEKGIITCNELINQNIAMRFTVKDFENYPSIFICANGTYNVKLTEFRAFSIFCGTGSSFVVRKHVGSTITAIATFTPANWEGNPVEFVVKKYGNRLSFFLKGKRSAIVSFIGTIENNDLSLFGNINGFSNGMLNLKSYICDYEFKPLNSYGKNIVLGGDSQTESGGIKAGLGTWEYLLKKYYNKNIDVFRTAVSGRTLSGVLSDYATVVTPKKSTYAENIYYINIGTNDYSVSNATTMLTKLDQIIALAKADGFKVFATTACVFPAEGVGTLKDYNDGIRARKASNAIDYLLDFYDDANGFTIGGAVKRQYIVSDGLHFSPEMRELVADKIVEILSINNMPDILTGIGSGAGIDFTFSDGNYLKVRSIDQVFTTAEKSKLANTTTSTFTSADGKTITVTGGMITSIV